MVAAAPPVVGSGGGRDANQSREGIEVRFGGGDAGGGLQGGDAGAGLQRGDAVGGLQGGDAGGDIVNDSAAGGAIDGFDASREGREKLNATGTDNDDVSAPEGSIGDASEVNQSIEEAVYGSDEEGASGGGAYGGCYSEANSYSDAELSGSYSEANMSGICGQDNSSGDSGRNYGDSYLARHYDQGDMNDGYGDENMGYDGNTNYEDGAYGGYGEYDGYGGYYGGGYGEGHENYDQENEENIEQPNMAPPPPPPPPPSQRSNRENIPVENDQVVLTWIDLRSASAVLGCLDKMRGRRRGWVAVVGADGTPTKVTNKKRLGIRV